MQNSIQELTLRPLQEGDLESILAWDGVPPDCPLKWLLLDRSQGADSLVACSGDDLVGLLPAVALGDPHPPERPPLFEWGRILLAHGFRGAGAQPVEQALKEAWLRDRGEVQGVVLHWLDRSLTGDPVPEGFERVGCWSVLEGLPLDKGPASAVGGACVETLPLDSAASQVIAHCVGATPLMGRRSSAWFDWRYGSVPGGGFGARGVFQGRELLGLAVLGPLVSGAAATDCERVLPLVEFWVRENSPSAQGVLIQALGREARERHCELQVALPPWHPAFTAWVEAGMNLVPTKLDLFARPAAWEPLGTSSPEEWRRRFLDLEGLRCAWPWSLGDVHFPAVLSGPGNMGT